MVVNRGHPYDVNQSNGRQLNTLRRTAEESVPGNASRRDYPVQSALTTHGKFRVIEKPGVTEAYTISLVSLSTPAVGGSIFTSCLKLLATSAHAEQRVREYPTEIVVLSAHEGKAVLGTSVLVKRLILYKQETSLFIKDNYHQNYFKSCSSSHIKSVSVCETSLSNIVMFATDNRKCCYLADENNQCDCRLFLEQISCVRPCEKPPERKCEKPPERKCEKPCERSAEKPCEIPREKNCEKSCEKPCTELELSSSPKSISNCDNQLQVHVCMFCGQGFIGGSSCGRVCNDFLKQKISKTRLDKCQPKSKPQKKRIRFCGCLQKKRKCEEVKGCELRIKYARNQKLFARIQKPSEVYIKKPCSANEQSVNLISCQNAQKPAEERCDPEIKCEPLKPSCSLSIQQEPDCQCRQCCPPQPIKPCSTFRPISPLTKKPQPQSDQRRGYVSPSSCGYPLSYQEKQSPPYGHSTVTQENSNLPCGHLVCAEKCPCMCNLPPPVCQEKTTLPYRCSPPQPICQEKAADICKCYKNCLPKSTSKTQIYKSKSEKLVGKRFHLICQKFESSDEETSISSVPDKAKPPKDKIYKATARGLSSQESTELSEDIKNDYDEKTKTTKTETKVGRVEINYSKSYYPFKARLQRDNVPLKKIDYSLSANSKTKHSMSSSNSSVSYLSIGRKRMKKSKFPVKIEDCRSCYLKVCKHGNKKKTYFSYSSGCSIKEVS